jgi:hypothetical protein
VCGNPKILAHGLCSICYTLKRQDEEYFGGLRRQRWNVTGTFYLDQLPYEVRIIGKFGSPMLLRIEVSENPVFGRCGLRCFVSFNSLFSNHRWERRQSSLTSWQLYLGSYEEA